MIRPATDPPFHTKEPIAMNRPIPIAALAVVAASAHAASNIADTRKHAWGENIGWINWRDANDTLDGVEVWRGSHLAGFAWTENAGWIKLGTGRVPYANTDDTNFGVNIDPATGIMAGFAWGENLGWINFGPFPPSTTAAPARWNAALHRAEGFAWSENAGWINLDDALAYVCSIPGDVNGDGAVDIFDFAALADAFGDAGNPPFTQGDVDGDGDTDVFDFATLADHLGDACP